MNPTPIRILFGQPHFSDRHAWSEVLAHFAPELAQRCVVECVPSNTLEARLSGGEPVEVVVPLMSAVTESVFASGVRLVQQFGVGIERIDLLAAERAGVVVANMPGLNAPFVAERAVALLLALLHRLPEARRGFEPGAWSTPAGRSVAGSVGCVIGLGAVGTAVCGLLAAFGAELRGVHRSRPAPGAVPTSVRLLPEGELGSALVGADFVIVAATHRPGSAAILSAELIAGLKPGAVVVNVARGGAIDNDASLAALESGAVGGLGLDVFPEEPYPADGPLLGHPAVVATAHTAALTDAYFAAAARRLGTAIAAWDAGRPVANTLGGPGQD
ncbi:hydroxyacid dehydrogenase [Microbacteriaceae bacterium VKM Ac-2854]|nr:hydroxyacid dehydrogenase [Microbacteriaceae bacterium VKM Ac-2854]